MVELVVYDFEDISDLEQQLIDANIQYQLVMETSHPVGHYGLKYPYLVIDGVPLDAKRARLWIKEHRSCD